MTVPLPVGVVGAGGMGRLHAQNIARYVAGARVVAIADVDRTRAQALADSIGGPRVYLDPRELIADREVRAVVVATPAATHAAVVIACAEAARDVFCEKPLATTLDAVHETGRVAAAHHIRLQVGFNRRFDPTYVQAKRAIEAGQIGKPLMYKGLTRDRGAPPRPFLEMYSGNGMMVDTTVHEFDAARWLMDDEVIVVQAIGDVLANPDLADIQGPDAAVINLRFSKGGLGNIDAVWGVRYGDDVRAEVIGSAGSLLIGTTSRLPVRVMTEAGLTSDGYPDHFDRFRDSYLLEVTSFVESVATDSPLLGAGPTDGIRAVEIALAAQRSMDGGMAPIRLGGE